MLWVEVAVTCCSAHDWGFAAAISRVMLSPHVCFACSPWLRSATWVGLAAAGGCICQLYSRGLQVSEPILHAVTLPERRWAGKRAVWGAEAEPPY